MVNDHKQLIQILKKYFGFDEFKPGQEEVINKLLRRKNVLSILPTGAGKTLIYQMYAMIQKSPILIVSPLLSLMQDQVNRLRYLGFKNSIAINSLLDWNQRDFAVNHLKNYQFIYVSPEMLSQRYVFEKIKSLQLGLVVIDEAHCVSQWGPDFRPEYLNLGNLLDYLHRPLTLMLTATASSTVRDDILNKLHFNDNAVSKVIRSVDRPNIFLKVSHFDNARDKNVRLINLINRLKTPGIVYFSSRKQANQIAAILNDECNINAEAYHSGLDLESRYKVQHQFMENRIDVICATSAFGMGIDKNDIRFVIHYHMPTSLESYMQEIGRAGRDGKQSIAIILYQNNDEELAYRLSLGNIPSNVLIKEFFTHHQKFVHLQEDWVNVLNYYRSHFFSVEQTIQIFERLRDQKQDSLEKIIEYIKNDECLRSYLLNAFDEHFNQHDSYCCDYHNSISLSDLNLLRDKSHQSDGFNLDWHYLINQLFNINNDDNNK